MKNYILTLYIFESILDILSIESVYELFSMLIT